MESFPLRRHDQASLRRAREEHGFLRHVPDVNLTHYIDATLPSDAVALRHVTRPVTVDGVQTEQTVHLSIHVPRKGRFLAREEVRANGKRLWSVHPKLKRFAAANALLTAGVDAILPEGIDSWQDAVESAMALLFHHPSLINLNANNGGPIPAYILDYCIQTAVEESGDLPAAIRGAGDDWMTTVRALGPKGVPLSTDDGKPVFGRKLDPDVQSAMEGVLAKAVRMTRDERYLQNAQWSVQYGLTSAPYGATARDAKFVHESESHHAPHPQLAGIDLEANDEYKWALKNLTPGSGLEIDSNVTYTPPASSGKWSANGMWSDQDQSDPFDAASLAALLDGKMYVKIATPQYPGGLLRGQLVPTETPKPNEAVKFTATLTGSGVVPPVTTSATATAAFELNSVRSGLAYSVDATGLGTSPSATFGIGGARDAGRDRRPFRITDQSGYGKLMVKTKNNWLRHLSMHVQFTTNDGTVIQPEGWDDVLPEFLAPVFAPNRSVKFAKLIPPVQTVFGIPIPADTMHVTFPVPAGAQKVRVLYGGLGQGKYDIAVCPIGIATTVTCEMAIPVILLVAGTAVMDSKPVVALMSDSQTLFAVCAAAAFLVAGPTAAYIGLSQDPARAVQDVAIALSPILLSASFALGRWLIANYAAGVAVKAVPLLNVAQFALSCSVTAAQLSQTTIEVLSSPFVFESEITRAIDLNVRLVPDNDYHAFPDQAVRYLVRVVYDKGATIPDQTFQLGGAPPRSTPIDVTFHSIPAGGRLKVYVFFYAANGWQAGQGESPWFEAKGTSGSTLNIEKLEVKTNIAPLGTWSKYEHQSKIVYDTTRRAHYWLPSTAPTDTRLTPSRFPGKSVLHRSSITTAQRPAQMAYSWEASGQNVPPDDPARAPVNTALYTMQNLATTDKPQEKFAIPNVGFSIPPGVFYDLTCPEDGSGRNFYIDPTCGEFKEGNRGGGLQVRRIRLTYNGESPSFALRTGKSFGRFIVPNDRYVMHPQGYVFGINYSTNKLSILKLADNEVSDTEAPVATLASGEGFRDGLMGGPQAIAVGMDGRVLILESIHQRIQAFDVNGNPVPYFQDPNDASKKIPTMKLADPADSSYLDLAVEAKGYLYVLRYRSAGDVASKYQVDLYEPNGRFLVTTTGVAAAKIAVDILRRVYALNYETILGANERPEPSVSLWTPPAPPRG